MKLGPNAAQPIEDAASANPKTIVADPCLEKWMISVVAALASDAAEIR
jgi:hypothetical protein